MGRGIFKGLLSGLETAVGQAADTLEPSNAAWYGMRDGLMGAFAVFYFLHPYFSELSGGDEAEVQAEQS